MSKEVKKVGRPTALLPIVVEKLEEAFKDNATIAQACASVNIDPQTYYNHRKNDKSFSIRMDAARSYTSLKAKRNITKAIDEGDLNTSKWHLEKTEYNQPQTPNVQVNVANIFKKQREEYDLDE